MLCFQRKGLRRISTLHAYTFDLSLGLVPLSCFSFEDPICSRGLGVNKLKNLSNL